LGGCVQKKLALVDGSCAGDGKRKKPKGGVKAPKSVEGRGRALIIRSCPRERGKKKKEGDRKGKSSGHIDQRMDLGGPLPVVGK